MSFADRALERHALAHHGLVSRRQARLHGLSRRQIQYRIRHKAWDAAAPGVLRLNGAPTTWRAEAMLATLATGGLASHLTAGALWDLHDLTPGRVRHVVVPPGAHHPKIPAMIHTYSQFHLAEPATIDGIPVTGVAVTIMDLAWKLTDDRLVAVVDDARRRHLITWPSLWRTFRRRARRGRNGSAGLRRLLDEHFGSRVLPDSGFNRSVGQLLVHAGLPNPTHEFELRLADGSHARYDLAWPDLRVAVELHSSTWHLNRSALSNDARKITQARLAGWDVVPFTYDQWRAEPTKLVTDVERLLELARGRDAQCRAA